MQDVVFHPIAVVRSAFPEKFGIPRQSGVVKSLVSEIEFLPEYSNETSLRGLDGFSHIWVLWYFSENDRGKWSPTVRPPRLGGNERRGVFATRSPFRPNPIGLSLVKLETFGKKPDGTVFLRVSGADIMDGTPVFDIKPYLPFADCAENAEYGFAAEHENEKLTVEFSDGAKKNIPENLLSVFADVLSEDPRPSYQSDPERIYSFEMYGFNVSFSVTENKLTVLEVKKEK